MKQKAKVICLLTYLIGVFWCSQEFSPTRRRQALSLKEAGGVGAKPNTICKLLITLPMYGLKDEK